MKSKFIIYLVFIVMIFMSCSNPLTQLSNQSSHEALYEDAKKAANNGRWNEAINKYQQMEPSYRNQRSIRFDYAKALAGACGYDFIGFAGSLGNANLGASTLMQYLLSLWGNKAITPDLCTAAELEVKEIWDVSTPTTTEQFFMALLSLAKMGMYLRYKADIQENQGLGNGLPDNTFDSCDDSDTPQTMTDGDIKEVMTGLGLFLQNIAAVGSAISNSLQNSSSNLSAACALVTPNPCAALNSDQITNDQVASMRNLLKFPGFGLNNTCIGLPDACCP